MPMDVIALVVAAAGLVYAGILYKGITSYPTGNEKMQKIAKAVQEGAMAFLNTEYKILAIFVLIVTGAFFAFDSETFPGQQMAISFVVGALCSGIAGYLGMRTATQAAVRTTEAAKSSLSVALKVAFSSGMVMGLCVVGLGLAGVSAFYMVWQDPSPIFGFGFGASSIALFARVGGGIFTKAADVGADLVGKVEAGIPEDDPRNPATIADNVGDNVGDVAGMGADLFESYVGSIIAAMALGAAALVSAGAEVSRDIVTLPLFLAAAGILASIAGRNFVSTEDEGKLNQALFRGLIVASGVFTALAAVIIFGLIEVPGNALSQGVALDAKGLFISVVTGLVVGVAIGKITEYYTSEKMGPAQEIAAQSETGAATNLIHEWR